LFTIDFEPVGRRGEFSGDQSLLECARQLSVDLVSICGGVGSCEHCKVQVISGVVSKLSLEEEVTLSDEELEKGYRLACMTYPESDVKLHVPSESLTAPQRTQVEGLDVDVEPDPLVRGLDVLLTPPTLEAAQADAQNLWQALNVHGIENGRSTCRFYKHFRPRSGKMIGTSKLPCEKMRSWRLARLPPTGWGWRWTSAQLKWPVI